MQKFDEYVKSTLLEDADLALDVMGIIRTFSASDDISIESEYVHATIPTKKQLDNILDTLPEYVEYEVLVTSLDRDFDNAHIIVDSDGGDEQEDEEYEIDDIDSNSNVMFELIVYTYNMDTSEDLSEVKRTIKVNSRGKRRIKMKCKKGWKFDGRKCIKISGKELVTKKRAIRKAVRTKRAKGSGYKKRIVRLANRARRKRKGMGLK